MVKVLKNYLADQLLLTKLFISRQKNPVKNFLEDIKSVKKILVILPITDKGETVQGFLQKLDHTFANAQISTFEITSLRKNDMNWLGVPNKNYLSNIQEEKFDLLIDLNEKPDRICTYLGALSKAAMRIHISENKYDKIYNLHIRSDKHAPLITRLNTLIDYLHKLRSLN